MHPFQKYILPSGLRIILVPQHQSLATTVMVLVEAGSKYETKNINGISHFLEHLCFKGTTKRPSALAITSELDSLGASYNAFTGHEVTGYHAKVRAEKTHDILELVADLYLNPIFNEQELEKEKGVVIEELNMYEDTPMRKVGDLFMEAVYGNQPAGWDIGGTKEVIRSLKRAEVIKYRSAHYVAKATTVAVAGNFNEKKIFSEIKKLFSHIRAAKKSSKLPTLDTQKKPATLVKYKESDQSHLVVGFRAFDMYDPRRYTLEVLADILGGGMSSRLFQKIRDELGAAYYVRVGIDLLTDHGLLTVSAGLDNKRVEEVLRVILDEFKKLVEKPVSNEELVRAKNHLVGGLMIGLETSDELASFYGQQEVFHKKIVTPRTLVKAIEGVTAKEIQKLAKSIIRKDRLNLAMIGPFKDQKGLQRLLSGNK